ncbi:MAG: ATP synthase F1 subunit gamma [Vampirovibrionia bacterium]
MPALKDIKRRIKSVKSTQKITQAMYMIATTKLKRAEGRVRSSRPFSNELLRIFRSLLDQNINITQSNLNVEKAINNYPALMKRREVKNVGLIVVASNKGLSGPYNTNVVRATIERASDLKAQGIGLKIYIIGLRAFNGLKRSPDLEIVKCYSGLSETVTSGETSVVAEDLTEAYVKEEIDKIEILTTEYVSKISNSPKIWPLLPLEMQVHDEEKLEELHSEMIFEPSPEEVLHRVLPLYIFNRLYQARLEAYTSELASRMTAMRSATDNADEMISSLTLTYNKVRQTSITQEILEVVSGADALK